MAKRSLADLYALGKQLSLDDGKGAVTVWLQKLNPVDHRETIRKADAARSRTLSLRKTPDCDDYQAIIGSVIDMENEQIIKVLALIERVRIAPLRESEIADEDEWKDDSYLDGLRDDWKDNLSARFSEDPEDEDAIRVSNELKRFNKAVSKAVEDEIEGFEESLHTMSEDEILKLAVDAEVKNAAEANWMHAYYRWELFFGVREVSDHKKHIFNEIADVDELDPSVFTSLSTGFRELVVDPTEGKDLAAKPPSSTSSAPSEEVETPESSGPSAVAA